MGDRGALEMGSCIKITVDRITLGTFSGVAEVLAKLNGQRLMLNNISYI